MADQMRYDCLSAYGDLGVRTPHLDELARECAIFDRAYCATPLCIPTRTTIATGKWPHTTGVIVNGGACAAEQPFSRLGPAHVTFYERLTEAGYRLAHTGVQHVVSTPPLAQRVPDVEFNSQESYAAYLKKQGFEYPLDRSSATPVPEFDQGRVVAKMYNPPSFHRRTNFAAEHFTDLWWANETVARIRAADPRDPHAWFFFAWAPHPPNFMPEPYYSLYSPADVRLPPNVCLWHDGMPATWLLGTNARGSQFHRDQWREVWAKYFGLVTLADEAIGRVIRALKERGFWDEALVIFMTDHGESGGAHCLYQKMTSYEESARVPLLIKPPGARRTGRRPQPVGHIDVANTLCDYAGIAPMAGGGGASLRPLIENPRAPWRDATFCQFNGDHGRGWPTRAIITERYKYIYNFGAVDELYDLREDPYETRSLIQRGADSRQRDDWLARLKAWMKETEDFLDIDRDDRDRSFHPGMWRQLEKTPNGLRWKR